MNATLTARYTGLQRRVVPFSPLVVVGLGYIVARAAAALWGTWAWVPVLVHYWGMLSLLIGLSGGRAAMERWLRPSLARRLWLWRSISLQYSAFWFGASHPLILGAGGATAVQGVPGFVGAFFVGLIWPLVYRQTRSLRWPIFGHFLQDILAPPILVFLNLVVLRGQRAMWRGPEGNIAATPDVAGAAWLAALCIARANWGVIAWLHRAGYRSWAGAFALVYLFINMLMCLWRQ